MTVTRDVILDLLPLYLADEASPDSKALVEGHMESDPDLAQLARQWKERMPGPAPAPVNLDSQAQAFREAKRWMAIKTVGVAAVIATGILALAALVALMFFIPNLAG